MTADQERARALRARAEEWPVAREVIEAAFPQPWHGYGLLAQLVFFVLTAIAIAAFFYLTRAELLTAILCIALAEFLIRVRKWFGTGVEAALWIGGLLAALEALPDSNRPEANLLIAAAAGVAGLRVRNPLFGVLAAAFVARYLEAVADLGTVTALVTAAAALFALYRTWIRPSTEWLFIALAVLMPLVGWEHANDEWSAFTVALYTVFAAIALGSGVARRHHAMFAAAAASAMVAGAVARKLFALPPELTLCVAGATLLAAAWLTMRLLRGRTRGLVVTPAALTPFDDDLQSLGTLAAPAAPSAGNPPQQRPGGGGSFGGGGATSDF